MRKLALDDDILLNIEKPARYIGGEVNAVMKEKELEAGEIAVRFAMCFPDVYEIGMSHLGIQILYDMFNRREDVWCGACLFTMDGSRQDHEGAGSPSFYAGISGSGQIFRFSGDHDPV